MPGLELGLQLLFLSVLLVELSYSFSPFLFVMHNDLQGMFCVDVWTLFQVKHLLLMRLLDSVYFAKVNHRILWNLLKFVYIVFQLQAFNF